MHESRKNAEDAMQLIDDLRWNRRKISAKEIVIDKYLHSFIERYCESHEIPESIKLVENYRAENAIILTDELVERVFENLVDNSIRAMGNKGELTLNTSTTDEYVKIEVHDTGHGIPQKLHTSVFREYFSAKPRHEPNNGVGLWWCKLYVEAFRGTIDFTSEVGKETNFIVQFPLVNGTEFEIEGGSHDS